MFRKSRHHLPGTCIEVHVYIGEVHATTHGGMHSDEVKKASGSSMSFEDGTTTIISPKPGTAIVAERCRHVLRHPVIMVVVRT